MPAPAAPAAADAPKADAPADAPAAEPALPSQEERTQAHIAELEKRKARALRFGQPTEELEKEIERVTKFGLPTTEGAASERVDSGLKKRAPPAQDKKAPKAAKTETKKPAEPAAPAVSVRRPTHPGRGTCAETAPCRAFRSCERRRGRQEAQPCRALRRRGAERGLGVLRDA